MDFSALERSQGTIGIREILACLRQTGKLPRRTSRRNTTLRPARTSAVSLRKRVNMPNGSVPPYGSKFLQETSDLTRLEGKAGKSRRRMVSDR